ncbi:response regulator [Arcobacter sp. CECT 8985]|uniref:response regulator n=1 Tax=Arcobacter sp. CECT 8985 TaxID=1935424 RepID=UPI00100BEDAC|nr:response regulator [Arcobacter sp. CECT 8985]RXJ86791.1 response regulator [Arcobacter sp. CECT 8985]
MNAKIEELKKIKLLFVEDEYDLIKIISDTLTKLEANFLTAQNGKEALDLIDKNDDIDIVITDINMPIINGLEMIEKIRETNPTLPIIIMTAHTESEYRQKAKMYGVENYLLKPFDFIKFIDLIYSMKLGKNDDK